MLKLDAPVVSVERLSQNFKSDNLIILDASIKKVDGSGNEEPSNLGIPNSLFFDIKNDFSDKQSDFPNTWPSASHFEVKARELGINNDSAIVVYDDKGIYSSARAWYMLKSFGHQNVAVLDGGLPQWIKKGFKLEERIKAPVVKGNFKADLNKENVMFFDEIKASVKHASNTILDARSAERFKGIEKEPRQGLRSGIIPGSQSLPYNVLMHDGVLKSPSEIKSIFKKFVVSSKPFVFSCGSGITACVLALGAELSGYEKTAIYDGSWTEWGTLIQE